jgi:ATP-dependent DNA ligase
MKKCPNGARAEIKYDGERIQVHKNGADLKFFSRALKPVKDEKLGDVRDYIAKAFPTAHSIVLDSEILLVDDHGSLLKFGTLGAFKARAGIVPFAIGRMCVCVCACRCAQAPGLCDGYRVSVCV